MEREQLSERIISGLTEAKRQVRVGGRPTGTTKTDSEILSEYKGVVRALDKGLSLREVAKVCDVSVNTVRKVKSAQVQ